MFSVLTASVTEGPRVCHTMVCTSLLAAAAVQRTSSGDPSGEGSAFNNLSYKGATLAYPGCATHVA
jgi:hypothetical protein